MTAPNPIPDYVGVRANILFIKILPIIGNISSNKTGLLPVTSSRGVNYIMVMVDYDSNAILAERLTSCTNTELLRAVKKLYEHLKERGLQPRMNMLGNE